MSESALPKRFRKLLSAKETSALMRVMDAYPMPSVGMGIDSDAQQLYDGMNHADHVPTELYELYDVKRGLRNADGSGVLVGLTTVSSVHGYNKNNGKVVPDEGHLILRGYDMADLVAGAQAEGRFGYEEVAYLLIAGSLPNKKQLDDFCARVGSRRELPEGYLAIFPRMAYRPSIMNVLQRATLLLYAFDPTPDDTKPIHEVDVALSLLGRWPRVASIAYAAENSERYDQKLRIPLDVMLMLHAEHGGGNNSTFTTRVLSSSGTDAYSAYAAALGSLKGPKHGGANYKAGEMIEDVAAHVSDWESDDEVATYLTKILQREAFDRTGLIYGLGHAVYTVTDPRAEIVKSYAASLAAEKGQAEKLELIKRVERLGPQVMRDVRGITKPISTNIDMYTCFVYQMLGIPKELFTPIFAIARMAGWAAHRMEELYGPARIIRPAYNAVMKSQSYEPLAERS